MVEGFATACPCGNGPSDLGMTFVEVTQPGQNLDRKHPAEPQWAQDSYLLCGVRLGCPNSLTLRTLGKVLAIMGHLANPGHSHGSGKVIYTWKFRRSKTWSFSDQKLNALSCQGHELIKACVINLKHVPGMISFPNRASHQWSFFFFTSDLKLP